MDPREGSYLFEVGMKVVSSVFQDPLSYYPIRLQCTDEESPSETILLGSWKLSPPMYNVVG